MQHQRNSPVSPRYLIVADGLGTRLEKAHMHFDFFTCFDPRGLQLSALVPQVLL